MRFEVHVEDIRAGFDNVRHTVGGALRGQVPDGMAEHVARAVAEIAAPMVPDGYTVRVAVSGKLAESWPNDDREADAVHVSVYLGSELPPEQPKESQPAPSDAMSLGSEDVAPVPQDVRSPE